MCVSAGTLGLALIAWRAVAGTRCRDLRDAVEPLGLKQDAEAEIAYLSQSVVSESEAACCSLAGTHSDHGDVSSCSSRKTCLRYQTHPCSSLRETEIFRLCPSMCRAVRISAHCTISPRGPPFRTLGLKTSPDSSVKNPT